MSVKAIFVQLWLVLGILALGLFLGVSAGPGRAAAPSAYDAHAQVSMADLCPGDY